MTNTARGGEPAMRQGPDDAIDIGFLRCPDCEEKMTLLRSEQLLLSGKSPLYANCPADCRARARGTDCRWFPREH
jgi:hypothetical protein